MTLETIHFHSSTVALTIESLIVWQIKWKRFSSSCTWYYLFGMKCFLRLYPKSFGVIIPAEKIPLQYCKFVFPCLNKESKKNCWKGNGFNVPLPLNSCHRLGCLFHICMLGSLCKCTTAQRRNSTYHWHSSIPSKNETQCNGTWLLLVINNHII